MTPGANLFVDTSGWADPILRNTPDYQRMAALYRNVLASGRPLMTTNYVLSELAALLTTRARAPRADILAYLRDIRTDPHMHDMHVVHMDPRLDEEAWDLLDRMLDKEWSLVDAASFVVMRRLGITEALTTDRHFSQAGFVRLPSE